MANKTIAKTHEKTDSGLPLFHALFGPVIAVCTWLKTPLDWIAFGCLVSDVLILGALFFFLLPVAKESNEKLIQVATQLETSQSALVLQGEALKANQEAIIRMGARGE